MPRLEDDRLMRGKGSSSRPATFRLVALKEVASSGSPVAHPRWTGLLTDPGRYKDQVVQA